MKRLGRWTGLALMALALAVGVGLTGSGFTIDEILDNGTASDPSDDLKDAARWSNISGSFVGDDVRGLGGGLEYAIAGDFFDRILPSFVDSVRPTKAQLTDAIRRAFDRWASGSPLRFVDVSAQVYALRDLGAPGSGAEIDLLAVSGGDLAFRNTTLAGNTFLIFSSKRPLGTGGELVGRTITSADILLNADARYYFNPSDAEVQRLGQAGTPLMHFESLLLHEVGHALGLDHPDEWPERNFDTDTDPKTPMRINCRHPLDGLTLSPTIDGDAVMIARTSGGYRLELTPDDVGGRDFLYPSCGQAPGPNPPPPLPPPSGGSWPLKQYDTNNNDLVDDQEFFTIIDAWINNQLDDTNFFKAIDLWVSQSRISSAGFPTRPRVSAEPSPSAVAFTAHGQEVSALRVEVFSLSGRQLFERETAGNRLVWHLTADDGRPAANGLYLYRVTVRGHDGRMLRSEVKKLVVVR